MKDKYSWWSKRLPSACVNMTDLSTSVSCVQLSDEHDRGLEKMGPQEGVVCVHNRVPRSNWPEWHNSSINCSIIYIVSTTFVLYLMTPQIMAPLFARYLMFPRGNIAIVNLTYLVMQICRDKLNKSLEKFTNCLYVSNMKIQFYWSWL